MRKVGRPKMSDEDRRSKTYFVRLKEDEYEELKKMAAEAGTSVAVYIRNKVFTKEEN